jgi:hypothetical protein
MHRNKIKSALPDTSLEISSSEIAEVARSFRSIILTSRSKRLLRHNQGSIAPEEIVRL